MKQLLFVLFLIVVGVVCLGFYQGWFGVSSDSTDGKHHVTFTEDPNKIKADLNKILPANLQHGAEPQKEKQ
jgi:hypothetical protein